MAAAVNTVLDIPERQILLRYPQDPNGLHFHHRVLFRRIDGGRWVVGTPDFDVHVEDLAGHEVRPLLRGGRFPADIHLETYAFDAAGTTDGDLQLMRQQANALADVLGAPAEAVPTAAGGKWLIGDVDSDDFGREVPEDQQDPALYVSMQHGPVRKRLLRRGDEVVTLEFVGDEEKWRQKKRPGLAGGHAGDLRLLGNFQNSAGKRTLTLGRALEVMTKHTFEDWPHRGPGAVREFLEAVMESGADLQVYHATFMRKSGLAENSAVSHELKNLITVLRLGISYDQVDVANLAAFEQIVRRILEIQIAVRRNPKHPSFDGLDQSTVGTVDEVGGARAPGYGQWLAEEAKKDAKILKATREWREEQAAERRRQQDGRGEATKGDGKGKKKKKGGDGKEAASAQE